MGTAESVEDISEEAVCGGSSDLYRLLRRAEMSAMVAPSTAKSMKVNLVLEQ
jgi:hypothetical protein